MLQVGHVQSVKHQNSLTCHISVLFVRGSALDLFKSCVISLGSHGSRNYYFKEHEALRRVVTGRRDESWSPTSAPEACPVRRCQSAERPSQDNYAVRERRRAFLRHEDERKPTKHADVGLVYAASDQ